MYEKSLLIIKPDGIKRRLTSQVLLRFETAGLKLHALKLINASSELAGDHYGEHRERPFFPLIVDYLTEGPVLAFVLGGEGAIARIRKMVGATTPADSDPGTIRGDFCHMSLDKEAATSKALYNLIHASANAEDAEREIALWFAPEEVLDYSLPDDYLHGA